jgi:hypothetical protein
MEFLSSVVLSGVLYDMLKHCVNVTSDSIQTKLKDWLITEAIAPALSDEIGKLSLSDELSEKAIENRINQSSTLLQILGSIPKAQKNTTITQTHSGTGDNIGRDKITN